MKLVWHPNAWDEYVNWQAYDRKILKRINTLIKDIQRGDDGGIGKPELLKVWAVTQFGSGEDLVNVGASPGSPIATVLTRRGAIFKDLILY